MLKKERGLREFLKLSQTPCFYNGLKDA